MDTKEYSEQFIKSGSKYFEDGIRAWERYLKSFSTDSGSITSRLEESSQKFTEFARNDGAGTVRKLIQINMDYYKSLMEAYLEFSENALSASRQGLDETTADDNDNSDNVKAQTASNKNIDLNFTQIKGRLQKEAFVVANRNSENIEVSFEISELICQDGKTKTKAPVTFKPDHFILEPGAEQVVECRLKLNKTLQAEMQYVAVARVVGFKDLYVRLIVSPK